MCSVFIVERQRLFTDNSSLELWHSITSYSPNIFGAGSRSESSVARSTLSLHYRGSSEVAERSSPITKLEESLASSRCSGIVVICVRRTITSTTS